MALKDTSAVIGETTVPKYTRIGYIRFDYPSKIDVGMYEYVDSVSAAENGPVVGKPSVSIDSDHVIAGDDVDTLKAMLDAGCTVRDLCAAVAYQRIKEDERFADQEDILEG